MRPGAVIAVFLSTLGLAASASAQDTVGQTVVSFAPSPPGKLISAVHLTASVAGEVGVTFAPDPATGCAAVGGCAYRGTLAWTPGGGGQLELIRYRQGKRVRSETDLSLGQGVNGPGSLTAARTERLVGAGQASCTDEQPALSDLTGVVHGALVTFSLADGLAATRCAGPLAGDLTGAAPAVTVSVRALERGRLRLDFRGQRRFAARGFAGTITSSLVVTLGRAHPAHTVRPNGPGQRFRDVSEPMTVSAATGSLTATVSGTPNPDVCVLLDSCGVKGTLTIAPRPAAGRGALVASGPATRPYVDFLTALGLSRAGRPAGIVVTGEVTWSDAGTVAAALHQAVDCTDTAPLGAGSAILLPRARTMGVSYVAGSSLSGGTGLRTRCPGPMFLSPSPLATGSVPRSALKRKRFTVQLAARPSQDDEGYAVSLGGGLRLSFRLGRVTQQVVSFPGG